MDAGWIRLAAFVVTLVVVSAAEIVWPRRSPTVPRWPRRFANLSLVFIANLMARMLMPLLPLGAAELALTNGWGLFNLLNLPVWLETILVFAVLDLVIYVQHRASHSWNWFWSLHRTHHTDLDIDVTSGIRFHPLEILISLTIKVGVVLIIGASPQAVLVFEILLNSTSLFNHGNIRLNEVTDRWLRLLLVTPDMHRVHHSIYPVETNSNYGFSVPWWDRIFGTYCAQPRDSHERMSIGLKEYRNPVSLDLIGLLMVPFRKPYG